MKTKKETTTNYIRRTLRWGSGIAVLALMPKCLLCVVAYLGLGAAMGIAGPEICGAAPTALPMWLWPLLAVSLVIGPAGMRRMARTGKGMESQRR